MKSRNCQYQSEDVSPWFIRNWDISEIQLSLSSHNTTLPAHHLEHNSNAHLENSPSFTDTVRSNNAQTVLCLVFQWVNGDWFWPGWDKHGVPNMLAHTTPPNPCPASRISGYYYSFNRSNKSYCLYGVQQDCYCKIVRYFTFIISSNQVVLGWSMLSYIEPCSKLKAPFGYMNLSGFVSV